MNFREQIDSAAKKHLLFTLHALDQMNKPDRLIAPEEVVEVVLRGEIIEDYPEDPRGHSCLMLGFPNQLRPIHIVCSPKQDYLAIVTSYVPTAEEWTENFRKRRR